MTEIEQFKEELKDHIIEDSRRFKELSDAVSATNEKLDRILEIYDGFNFIGRFLVRSGVLAGAVTAVAALLYAFLQFIRTIK